MLGQLAINIFCWTYPRRLYPMLDHEGFEVVKMKSATCSERGFSLLEVLVAMAIIAIVASTAIPSYRRFIARSQVSEAVGLAIGAESYLTQYHQDRGNQAWPTPAYTLGLYYPPAAMNLSPTNGSGGNCNWNPIQCPGRYTMLLSETPPINGTFSQDSRSQTIGVVAQMKNTSDISPYVKWKTMEVWTTNGGITWNCGIGQSSNASVNGSIPLEYLPSTCQATGGP